MEWKEKKFKVFVFEDYWFLCKLYGLSVPSDSYPCLWCQESKGDMQDKTRVGGAAQPRTLEILNENYNLLL